MLATYIGKDGAMGFKTGIIYNIAIDKDEFNVTVRTSEGKVGVYSNEKSMQKNWKYMHENKERT